MLDSSPSYDIIESTPASEDDLWLTADEVAKYLRTDVQTLANLRSRGEGIPYSKPLGRVLYKMADVLAAASAGARGFSRARLAAALDTYGPLSKLSKGERERLLLHIIEVQKG
jgi:hypothetical protein